MDFQNIISLVGGFGPIKLFNLAILFTKVPVQSQGSERLCIYVLGVSCLPSFFHLNILELFQQCCIFLFLFLFKLTTTYGIVNQRVKNFTFVDMWGFQLCLKALVHENCSTYSFEVLVIKT